MVNVPVSGNTTILEITNYADKAAYHAKTSGKNVIYASTRDVVGDVTTYTKLDF